MPTPKTTNTLKTEYLLFRTERFLFVKKILKKLESPSLEDTWCQIWLKLNEWFWRGGFLYFINGLNMLFRYHPSL